MGGEPHFSINSDTNGQAEQGAGFRGGDWNNNAINLRMSDRNNAANTNTNRNNNNGGRGVRVSP
jgi:hypothetical protein